MIWAYLVHLGVNMWSERAEPRPHQRAQPGLTHLATELVCDKAVWDRVTSELARAGFTHVVIDLGEAVRYDSHPEIAVPGAWTPSQLREELARLRSIGLTPLPKLNFSATHDAWLGEYGRHVSTPLYYRVCGDLIAEVCDLFDHPAYFHLGMDEELAEAQPERDYLVVRRGDLWWHDLALLCDQVRGHGARPWIWSDSAWRHPDQFYRRMPKDVLQSNWYHGLWFVGDESPRPRPLSGANAFLAYLDLDDHGYDQIPTGTSWRNRWDNFDMTVDYCSQRVAPERLIGFLQTPWVMTTAADLDTHLRTIRAGGTTISRARSTDFQ